MAHLMLIDAADYHPEEIDPLVTGRDVPPADVWENRQVYIERAIAAAREQLGDGPGLCPAVVVTLRGSLMAMVRWNIEVDADPPVEVVRFADVPTYC